MGRLRSGIGTEVSQIAQNWGNKDQVSEFFASTEAQLNEVQQYQNQLTQLIHNTQALKKEIEQPIPWLGYRAG